MNKIGIIGVGYVGKAVAHGFQKNEQILIDPRLENNLSEKDLVTQKAAVAFICVPTPQSETGEVDASIIEKVLTNLNNVNYSGLVVIKSTVTPDKLGYFSSKFADLRLIYNPEFLTERNYLNDFVKPDVIIIGATNPASGKSLEEFYWSDSIVEKCPVIHTDLISASLAKYTINSYLASKVAWMNQLYDLHRLSRATTTWDEFIEIFSGDHRIGKSHLKVPGPDGRRGFGGTCFPKDTAAFEYYAKKLGHNMSILSEVIRYNKEIRPE